MTTSISAKCKSGAALLLAILVQTACGGGGSDPVVISGTDATADTEAGAGSVVDDGVTPDPGAQIPGTESDSPAAIDAGFPFAGSFVLDEYSPSVISPEYEGIVEIIPSPLSKTRVLNGSLPRSYLDGRISYRESCGQGVSRIALADANRLSTPITPCSSEIPNEGASPTDFRQSHVSPDGSLVAVEARAFIGSGYVYSTIVFEITSQVQLATWDGGYEATWMPDGRLLMASDEGLFLLDSNLDDPTRLGEEITGPVGNPDVSADGSTIVFEFNQPDMGHGR